MAVLLAAVNNVFYVISYFQGLCDVVHIFLVSLSNRNTLQFYVYIIACVTFQVVYNTVNPLNAELNPICYLLALLGAHHFLHFSRIRVKSLTFR